MQVCLISSSVSGGDDEANQYLSTYLVNERLAIDAGSLGFYRGPAEQSRIKHLLLSHSHIDHLASLPIFVDNAYRADSDCVTIHASDEVLDCLRRDIFNDRIWPDFIRLSESGTPLLKLSRLEANRTIELDGLRITPIPVNHVVPTLGFLIEDEEAAVLIPTDTGPTEAIWERANRTPTLRAVFLEASFPNSMAKLADLSRHLTPRLFVEEARKLRRPAKLLAVHLKPAYRTAIAEELLALDLPDLEIARAGKVYQFGGACERA